MKALHLDYQAPRPRPRAGVLALVVAAIVVVAALAQFERLRQERARWDAELARVQSRTGPAGAPGERGQGARAGGEAAAAQAVIRKLNVPWNELFGALESAAGDQVALLGIEPDPAKGSVRLTAEARAAKGMFDYVRRLQQTAFLDEVVLQKHELQTEDPDKPVRFSVVATWKVRD